MSDCPACGQPQAALVCAACGHDRAPTSCAACFHRNEAGNEACAGCGEPLGLEPVFEAGPLACPACGGALREAAGDEGLVRQCAPCGGLFVEHGALAALVTRAQREGPASAASSVRKPTAGAAEPVRYLGCPCCARPMNRKNFGRLSGVVVDVCREHGTFFHLGELPRVLAFVRGGGLERAARRAADEARDKQREEAARVMRERLVEAHRVKWGPIGNTHWSGDEVRLIFESIIDLMH